MAVLQVSTFGAYSASECNSKPRCMICANEHGTMTCPHKGEAGELMTIGNELIVEETIPPTIEDATCIEKLSMLRA